MLIICDIFNKVNGIIVAKYRKFDDQETGNIHVAILLKI